MMESIEKLRSCGVRSHSIGMRFVDENELQRIADEIEAEIADKQEAIRKRCKAECVHWENEMHKVLDALNGSERFWGACMEYPLDEHTIPPSEIAKKMLSERYMLLPVDADGVPIHMGDTVEGELFCDDSVVKGIVNAYHIYADDDPDTVYIKVGLGGMWTIKELRISRCRHVKPRMLEDVLREFIAAYDEWDDNAVDDRMERRDELFAKYADEIRELMSKAGD